MTLKDTLHDDLTAAIKSHDKVRAATLRMTLAAVTNAEVAGKSAKELSDDEVLKVVTHEAKKRREAAEAYHGANRPELAANEEAELAVLESYLPTQLSDDELAAVVDEALAAAGATSMAQMGQAMKAAQGAVAGRAEGGRVAALVKARLQRG